MKKKIGFVGEINDILAQRWIEYFAADPDFAVYIFCYSSLPAYKKNPNINILEFNAHNMEIKSLVKKYIVSRRMLKKIKLDYVLLMYVDRSAIWFLLHNVPLISFCYGSDIFLYSQADLITRFIVRRALKSANFIIGETPVFINAINTIVNDDVADKFHIVNWGVDFGMFDLSRRREYRAVIRKEYNIDDDNIVIISNRNFQVNSNIDIILQGVDKFINNYKNVTMIFIKGYNQIEPEFVKWFDAVRNKDKIILIDRVPYERMVEYLAAADIFVSIPVSDSISISLLEAMYVGVFPIVSRVPALETWFNRCNGIMLEETTPEKLYRALQEIVETKNSDDILRYNQKIIKSKFDFQTNADKLKEILLRDEVEFEE